VRFVQTKKKRITEQNFDITLTISIPLTVVSLRSLEKQSKRKSSIVHSKFKGALLPTCLGADFEFNSQFFRILSHSLVSGVTSPTETAPWVGIPCWKANPTARFYVRASTLRDHDRPRVAARYKMGSSRAYDG
jgi:hypothetical protein